MTQLVPMPARELPSRALESSKPSLVYIHAEPFRACRVQMRIMQQLASLVNDEIDLFVVDDFKEYDPLAQVGITHAPALIFYNEGALCVIEGITPVETLIAVVRAHLGVDLRGRQLDHERRMIPC